VKEYSHTSEYLSEIGLLNNPKFTKVNGISKYARIGIRNKTLKGA